MRSVAIFVRSTFLSGFAIPTLPEPSKPVSAEPPATVTVFASAGSWIESDAVDQCHQVAALFGMRHVAGMPDLHPGKGRQSGPR